MSWLRTPKQVFFVRSGEQNPCPFCDGLLKVIGSRRRGYIDGLGERKVLMIRRLWCSPCNKIHHELPDLLVPYKRHESKSIEAAVSEDATLTVAADESTIIRWKQWFSDLAGHFAGALFSIAIRFGMKAAEEISELSQSPLLRIWQYVGDAPRWLARVVRPVVNANFWAQTRSAFLSG
jgi:hypothetical protein